MNAKRMLIAIEKFGFPVLLGLTTLCFLLALFQQLAAQDRGADALWLAFADTLTTDAQEASGWLKAMHVALTVTLGWAVIRVYMTTAGFTWDSFAARHLAREHVVIVAGRSPIVREDSALPGAGRSSRPPVDKVALAIDLALSLAPTRRVVLCLPRLDDASPSRLWEAGVTVLRGELAMPAVLEATGVRRASLLIAMRDHHDENVVLVRAALAPSFGNSALECRCMIEPLSVRRELRLDDYLEPHTLARVRLFNESELLARRIVRDYPPDAPVATGQARVHLLLVGLGSVGQSILLQMARMGHYRSGHKPKLTVVDREVKARWREIREACPAVTEWLDVETHETRIEEVSEAEIDHWARDEYPITMVYVCTRNELANLRISRLLMRGFIARAESDPRSAVPDVVALDPPGGCVLSDFALHGEHRGRFHVFSLLRSEQGQSRSAIAESVLSETDDQRARLLHEDYCASDDRACALDPSRRRAAANLPWEVLPETYRQSNRLSADHIDVKLRAVSRQLAARGSAPESPLSAEELETLARMEHDRWWAERALDGWTYAEQRNNQRKHHPNMLPWAALSEPVRQLDRDNVQNILRIACGDDRVLAMN
jgi:hypothetical protein